MKRISDGTATWARVAAGALAGFLVGVLVARRKRNSAPRGGGRLSGAWNGAVEGLVHAREQVLGGPEVDLEVLRARLSAVPGSASVRVRRLGEGIVELVGTASDADAGALLRAAAAEPGVKVVVNRVWTPSSARPDGD